MFNIFSYVEDNHHYKKMYYIECLFLNLCLYFEVLMYSQLCLGRISWDRGVA